MDSVRDIMSPLDQMGAWDDSTRSEMLTAFDENDMADPVFFENKKEFWKRAMHAYCLLTKSVVFDLESLNSCIQARAGASPRCLASVLVSSLCERRAVTLEEMMQMLQPPSTAEDGGWTLRGAIYSAWVRIYRMFFPGAHDAAKASASTASMVEETFRRPKFAIPELVQGFGEMLYRVQMQRPPGRDTVRLSTLRREIEDITGDETSVQLMLLYLQKQTKCIIQRASNGSQYVTFIREQDCFEPPTKNELNILQLNDSVCQIRAAMDDLTQRIEGFMRSAVHHKKKGNAAEVMNCLRFKRHSELDLERRNCELNQHLKVINALEQNETSIKMYNFNKRFCGAIKDSNMTAGLTANAVDDAILDVNELLEETEDLQTAMKQALSGTNAPFSEADLNREFAQFMAEVDAEEKEEEQEQKQEVVVEREREMDMEMEREREREKTVAASAAETKQRTNPLKRRSLEEWMDEDDDDEEEEEEEEEEPVFPGTSGLAATPSHRDPEGARDDPTALRTAKTNKQPDTSAAGAVHSPGGATQAKRVLRSTAK